MKKLLIPSIVFLALSSLLSAESSIYRMPPVSGKDLNGKPWVAPAGLPGSRTLVFVAFEEEQQTGIDSWLEGLKLKTAKHETPWIEMPLINDPGMFMRWFINTGMKHGIPDPSVRAHVWTAYTDKKAFLDACGMGSTNSIYALVVNRNGQILAMQSGNYSKAGAEQLLRAMQSPSKRH